MPVLRRGMKLIKEDPVRVGTFETLAQAVDFIAACTESDSALTLFNRTVHSERPVMKIDLGDRIVAMHGSADDSAAEDFARRVFPKLRQQHAKMDLRVRYKGGSFPTNAERLKLGGHDKELGHIHIDFIQREDGWAIERIWECR